MNSLLPIRNVLISVYDKSGLDSLVPALKQWNCRIYSTGGTAAFLDEKLGTRVERIEDLTGFPEILEGRVKTLHPKVFGGILARRGNASDEATAKTHGMVFFDLVIVNFYPFAQYLKATTDEQTKYVDIGGPSMLRAGAKNFASICVLSDPKDYAEFLEKAANGSTTREFRQEMAVRTFSRTSAYDAMIAGAWKTGETDSAFPDTVTLTPRTHLRYGENPHQKAAWVGTGSPGWKILQGKELSYNNLLDAHAALQLTAEFSEPFVGIIKHNNPCGAAAGEETLDVLFKRALDCDSKSAFGGIVAVNRPVDAKAAGAMAAIFLEVIAAPLFTEEALQIFSKKPNLRLIQWEKPEFAKYEVRAALDGWLIQETDALGDPTAPRPVTETPLPPAAWNDLRFAWKICKHVHSNAIVLAKNGAILGSGGGQTSRIESLEIALRKARTTEGAVLASDAFFPFRDSIDRLKGTGVTAIIQPGGSKQDPEVIKAANEAGIAMVFTGERHFKH